MHGLIGHANVQGARVCVGVDGNGLDVHGTRRFDDTARNLTAVCYQDLFKHRVF
jgi:hypothetical protein